MLSWYPSHPTSMNFTNNLISSDHKGRASALFENKMKKQINEVELPLNLYNFFRKFFCCIKKSKKSEFFYCSFNGFMYIRMTKTT